MVIEITEINSFIENEIVPKNKYLSSFFIHTPNLRIDIDFEIIFKIPFSLDYDERKLLYNEVSKSIDSYFKEKGANFSFLLIFQEVL